MKICVIGTGYVGLVTGTCLAEAGNDVICVDIDQNKIDMLTQGKIPIWEPGLEVMVLRNYKQNRLKFTSDTKKAVENSDICFIAVGTPPDEDGSADLQYVLAVAKDIAKYMNEYKVVVDKSTVPVGTAEKVKNVMSEILIERKVNYGFDVVSNPEFLKEGDAVNDFMKPDRIVIGTDSEKAAKLMRALYEPFSRTHEKTIIMSVRSAEMTKYAANAMLATKISFMNDIANLCEKLGADIHDVRFGIGSDTRIGYKFIYPGVGYGGSCFPKDVQALIKMAENVKSKVRVLEAVEDVNNDQKKILVKKVIDYFGKDLSGKTFAIWGLAFKPKTDDMRAAPSRVIINLLIEAGAKIKVYDPVATDEAKRIFCENSNIEYSNNNYDALIGCDAMLLVTEWHQFRYPDFDKIKSLLKSPIIFDGRNQYNPCKMKEIGFIYYSIGRK
ncbi:MAG: UDP-glucose/GDP-mannose dehydrogenase family protein [Candidatus Cloacimonetes bacterium]|nr:UDP-glucose/GDP-mannose dehydrogenase family protein [Candidatus Cloacimonadota bacterium]